MEIQTFGDIGERKEKRLKSWGREWNNETSWSSCDDKLCGTDHSLNLTTVSWDRGTSDSDSWDWVLSKSVLTCSDLEQSRACQLRLNWKPALLSGFLLYMARPPVAMGMEKSIRESLVGLMVRSATARSTSPLATIFTGMGQTVIWQKWEDWTDLNQHTGSSWWSVCNQSPPPRLLLWPSPRSNRNILQKYYPELGKADSRDCQWVQFW